MHAHSLARMLFSVGTTECGSVCAQSKLQYVAMAIFVTLAYSLRCTPCLYYYLDDTIFYYNYSKSCGWPSWGYPTCYSIERCDWPKCCKRHRESSAVFHSRVTTVSCVRSCSDGSECEHCETL